MILPRPMRKFIAVFRGGISPLLIILSVTSGFCFGLIPGLAGIHAVIILVFLALNIHLGLFLMGAAFGKAFCFAAAPLLFHTGSLVHSYIPGLLAFLARIPIVGLTDFGRYSTAGAIIIGPPAGLALGLVLSRTVVAFRKNWLKLEENSEAFKKWSSKRWVRVLDRLLIGKSTADVSKALEGKSPVVRKAGLGLAVVSLILAGLTGSLVGDDKLASYAAGVMTRANGAEVNVADISFSLLRGKLAAEEIEVTNPEKPSENRVSVGGVAADTDVYNLLCGNLVLEDVVLSNVVFDQARQTPGKVLADEPKPSEPAEGRPRQEISEKAGINRLQTYFKNAKKVRELLRKIGKFLPEPKQKSDKGPRKVPERYLEYLRAKAPTAPASRLTAKRIVIEEVELDAMQFGKSSILMTNISDNPYAAALPVGLEITSMQNGQSLNVMCHFESKGDIPEITGTFENFDLQKLQSQMSDRNKLILEGGTASGTFNGSVSKESLDLRINVKVENLQASSRGKRVLGLDSKSVSRVFDVLKSFETEIRLSGPTDQPRLSFDTGALTEQFKTALAEAGKQRLKEEIDEQLQDKLGGKVPDQVKEALKKPGDLIKGLGGLLQKKKEEP